MQQNMIFTHYILTERKHIESFRGKKSTHMKVTTRQGQFRTICFYFCICHDGYVYKMYKTNRG